MANLVFSLNIDPAAVRNVVLDDLAKRLDAAFRKATGKIASRVGEVAAAAIQGSPEYESLLAGKLRHQLGVVDAQPILNAVVANIKNGVFVTSLGAVREGENIKGGLRIELLKGDYSEVLNVSGATFSSEKGYEVAWLQWLTMEGDSVLVSDFHFLAGHGESSRTDDGIMVPRGSWRVPPEFSGTVEDNWLTRALDGILPAVETILFEEIQGNL